MSRPETSIVIRAFNEARFLPQLIEAIDGQDYRDFEVIVVDSGSYDGTPEIALRSGAQLVRINSSDFTFGYSLNVGIRSARGRFICLVSAHAQPVDSSWLANLVDPLREHMVAMTYGRQVGAAVSKFAEVQDFRRTFGRHKVILRPPAFFANNANSAIRRDLWQRRPFDEVLPGLEDIEWAKYWMNRDYQVIYEPASAIRHIHDESWPQVRRRYYREARAASCIEVKRCRHIPLEILREGKSLVGDLVEAGRAGCLREKSGEILLFRMNKTLGAVRGLWDGWAAESPNGREEMFFDRSFKAAVIHGPGRAALDDVRMPEMKPGDVLIKVAYAGVCATDLEILDGALGYYKSGTANYPIIPGHEFSGRIAKVGSNVEFLEAGDPVVAECIHSCGDCVECRKENWIGCRERREVGVIGRNGGYGEYVVLPGRFVHTLPESTDLKKAALCEPLAVVLKGLGRLERAWGPGERKTCAVVGAGPIGHLCAQLLLLGGHQVTVFDRNPLRRACLEGSGVETRSSTDLDSLDEFAVLIEATGDPEALDAILRRCRAGSCLLLLGLPYARRELDFESIVAYDQTIVGSVGSTARDFEDAIALLPRMDLDQFTETVFPLQEFQVAWKASRSGRHLKVLLEADQGASNRPEPRECSTVPATREEDMMAVAAQAT